MQDRQAENQRLIDNKDGEEQIQKIKEEARKEVEEKREALRKKIADIKARAARRKRIIEQDIDVIRSKMTQGLIDANKKGDENNCRNAYGDKEKIESYCNKNAYDDIYKNAECKEPLSFCYVCCDTEFGNMQIIKKDHCNAMCDDLARKDLDKGEYLWR